MKNITVSVPDELYRVARIRAAEQGTSVTALVRTYLESLSPEDDEFRRLERLQEEALDRITAFSMSENVSRDELHDRDALRQECGQNKRP